MPLRGFPQDAPPSDGHVFGAQSRSIAINLAIALARWGTNPRQQCPAISFTVEAVAVLLTVAEVAAELRVSERTVLGFINAGELRALEGLGRGRGLRVRREWLEAFLRGREKAIDVAPPEQVREHAPKRRSLNEAFTSARDARVALGLIPGGKS